MGRSIFAGRFARVCAGFAFCFASLLGTASPQVRAEGPRVSPDSAVAPLPKRKPRPARRISRIELMRLKASLDESDQIAALQAIHYALTQVGDGSKFVWERRQGRLNGTVQPTSSFRGARGRICRHIVVELTLAHYTKRTEGIACRLENGGWSLSG